MPIPFSFTFHTPLGPPGWAIGGILLASMPDVPHTLHMHLHQALYYMIFHGETLS